MKINTKYVSVPIPPAMYEALKKLAEQDGRKVPSYIRRLLWRHLDEKDIIVSILPPQEE